MTDLDDDTTTSRRWWAEIAPTVGADVRGLWFGLFTELRADETEAHTMYVAGTPTFELDDGGDWACDYLWLPKDRYLRLAGLAAIPTSEWQAALRHAVRVVQALAPWNDEHLVDCVGVGVGFDEGDLEIVWFSPSSTT